MKTTTIIEKEEGVAVITLNRPERFNAMSTQLLSDVEEAVKALDKDDDTKVIVITGAGEAFCAGGDLEGHPAFSTDNAIDREQFVVDAQRITLALRRMPKPVIAAVNGVAAGAGMDLSLACDLRIASEKARFVEIFVRSGLMTDMGGSYLLPRLVGVGKALEILLAGDIIDADEAHRIGLVNQVVPHSELMTKTMAMARRFAKGPSQAYKLIKWSVYRGLELSIESALENEVYGQNLLLGSEDVHEAVNAFNEKRKPIFKGR